jgi:endonuclease-3
LTKIAARGGIEPGRRAEHIIRGAEIVVGQFGGDLDTAARRPYQEARRAMKRLPMTADSGADRMLMFAGAHPVLGLESNGVRVLQRIGYAEERLDFNAAYRSIAANLAGELPAKRDALVDAHLQLRELGRTVCKTSGPRCGECAIRPLCGHGMSLR